jgi:hypothetical protein
MPPVSTSKRSACNRCRNMKLRCPPYEGGDNTLSCGRCLRLGVHCVTSFPRLVRPHPKDNTKTASTISSPCGPGPMPRSNLPPNRRSFAPMDMEFDLGDWTELGVARDQGQGKGQSDMLATPTSTPNSLSSTIPEHIMPFFDSNHHEPIFGNFNLYDLAHAEDPNGATYENSANILALSTLPIPRAPRIESEHRLISLRINLSKQSRQYRAAATTETLDSPESASSCRGKDMGIDQNGSMRPLWFGDALQSISNFLSIIEDCGQELYATTDHHNSSTCPPAISIVIFLDILSAYLEIVAIYDDLCAHLYNKLRACSQGSPLGFQIFPGLQLAGLSVEHSHLQTKILIQVVVHQFEMIEKVLGLPILYRISGRRDTYTGLLKDERGKRLLGIVMEDKCGSNAVNSLRECLKNIEQFIHM